jgi:threonylcarbamoyladenosine tRNA methylthiotransferase MtaB
MKVFLDMVGCRLNQSEIEAYASQLRLAGHSLTSNIEEANMVIINTCTVTTAAASDSRQKIRQAARAGAEQIIVTGCYAALNPGETFALPGVTQIIDNQDKDDLVSLVLNLPASFIDQSSIQREPIPGTRLRTRAFIKVQDGCDNACTYCITRLARGKGRSRPIEPVLKDINCALSGGTKEIVLTGVHLGSWGYDFGEPQHISSLVRAILDQTTTPRLRLSSLEPWDITPDFFELWKNERICRQLHLPLQSGCAATLKRMGRKITPEVFGALVHEAHRAIPGVAVTTDIITGFPGETEDEFTESAEFVKAMNFADGHVFTFSARPGTSAAKFPDPVPTKIAKTRNALMRQILERSEADFRLQQVGSGLAVLWERAVQINHNEWQMSGLSDNYVRIQAKSSVPCQNQIMQVNISGVQQDYLIGNIQGNELGCLFK